MDTPLRLFFAIELNDEVRAHLTHLINRLQQEPWKKYIHWTHPENLHITLRFIGVCQLEKIPVIISHVKEAIKTFKHFTIHLDNIGLFPTKTKPRVLAINIHPAPALFQLANAIEQSVVAAGFAAEPRAYLPHLTIGRLEKRHAKHLQPQFPAFEVKTTVNKIVLLNSELIAKKRLYKAIQHFLLA